MIIEDTVRVQLGAKWFELQLLKMESGELLVDEDLQAVDCYGNYLSIKEVKRDELKTNSYKGS